MKNYDRVSSAKLAITQDAGSPTPPPSLVASSCTPCLTPHPPANSQWTCIRHTLSGSHGDITLSACSTLTEQHLQFTPKVFPRCAFQALKYMSCIHYQHQYYTPTIRSRRLRTAHRTATGTTYILKRGRHRHYLKTRLPGRDPHTIRGAPSQLPPG